MDCDMWLWSLSAQFWDSRKESLRVPNITLYLVLGLRNPWKMSVRGTPSPRLRHAHKGGGLNAFRASKPVLFTNKMQLWVNHCLSPTCWHMHPLMLRWSTCFDTAPLTVFHAKLSSLFLALSMDCIWVIAMQRTQINHVSCLHTLVDWCKRSFTSRWASSLKWRYSQSNTWLCESCSNQSSPQPSTSWTQLDTVTGLNQQFLFMIITIKW